MSDFSSILPPCSVCLESFSIENGPSRLKNCGHVFHQDCVNAWLGRTKECPYCRRSAGSKDVQFDFVLMSVIENLQKTSVDLTPPIARNPQVSEVGLVSTLPQKGGVIKPFLPRFEFELHPHVLHEEDPTEIYSPAGVWLCDICGRARQPTDLMLHCQSCGNFDLCGSCIGFETEGFSSWHDDHALSLSRSTSVYTPPVWACDGCGTKGSGAPWHCYLCENFDLCQTCYAETSLQCVTHNLHAHELHRSPASSAWMCDVCQRPGQGYRFHCAVCPDFDMCTSCIES